MVVEPLKTGQPPAVSCQSRTGIQSSVHRAVGRASPHTQTVLRSATSGETSRQWRLTLRSKPVEPTLIDMKCWERNRKQFLAAANANDRSTSATANLGRLSQSPVLSADSRCDPDAT